MAEGQGAVGVDGAGVRIRARRVEVVVVDGRGAHVAGERDGQPAGGVGVAEEHVGQGAAALLRRVELLHQGRRRARDPGLRDGLAGAEDDDGGLSGVDYGPDEMRHCAH